MSRSYQFLTLRHTSNGASKHYEFDPFVQTTTEYDEMEARINSHRDTMEDHLKMRKFHFRYLFIDETPAKAVELLWEKGYEFAIRADELKCPDHIINRLFSDNNTGFGEKLPDTMTVKIPAAEIQDHFHFTHPPTNLTVNLAAKMLNTHFGMEVYSFTSKQKAKKYKYETSKTCLSLSSLCKKYLACHQETNDIVEDICGNDPDDLGI